MTGCEEQKKPPHASAFGAAANAPVTMVSPARIGYFMVVESSEPRSQGGRSAGRRPGLTDRSNRGDCTHLPSVVFGQGLRAPVLTSGLPQSFEVYRRAVSESARRANREDKRRRIIDAAVEVFADKGFYNARVAEIADAAGVADGTIYL